MDANGWVERLTAFDTAKKELLSLAKKVDVVSKCLATWHEFHQSGKPAPSHHRSGRTNFNVQDWPSGDQINDALDKCHQAYRALMEGFNGLSENDRKALKLDEPPAP